LFPRQNLQKSPVDRSVGPYPRRIHRRRSGGAWLLFLLPLLASVFWPDPLLAQPDGPVALSRAQTGGVFRYRVKKGDFLLKIRGEFGESLPALIRANGLANPDRIFPGEILLVDNRHLVPPARESGILINIPQKMLFFFSGKKVALAAPVALGRRSWPTPGGVFHVVAKKADPVWVVPLSIQKEMRRHGEKVLTKVPPGPANPLGKYWMGLDLPNLGIHGTNAPASVYGFTTHGCIRLFPDAIRALFSEVPVGTSGKIVDAPVLVEPLENGRVLLEVDPDVYHKERDLGDLFKRWMERHPEIRIDWKKAGRAILEQRGIPVDVGFPRIFGQQGGRSSSTTPLR